MSADALTDSCADIQRWYPVAQALTAQPDTDGTAAGGKPGSRPPWNPSAASAAMDAHELVRRLEASLRLDVTGHPGPRRGGSDANTMAAIAAIENLGYGARKHVRLTDAMGRPLPCPCGYCQASRLLDRASRAIQQLPAVDVLERPQRVAAICPYCEFGMLWLSPRAGRVTCLRWGVCFDGRDEHPVGFVQQGLDGSPLVQWADGLVQYGTMEAAG